MSQRMHNCVVNGYKQFSHRCLLLMAGLLLSLFVPTAGAIAAELAVGTASADITPTGPAAIQGPLEMQIAKGVETPVTANVIVMESREVGKSLDTAVMVSCDLSGIPLKIQDMIRTEVHKHLPDLDMKKIFVCAMHIHSAPVFCAKGDKDCFYQVPKEGVVQVEDYQVFLAQRVADAVVRAWNSRTPCSVTWGLGHAKVAENRRAIYADGHAAMYGKTDQEDFRGLEGYEDHDVNTLFFWNNAGKLVCIVVNVSCPAQVAEGCGVINADYWHPVRELLHKRYGPEVGVVGWIGAAGDQSPHLMYRSAADDRMTRLRGLTRLQEIARRIDRAVDEAYEAVKNDRHVDVPMIHKVETLRLPMWLVTEQEYTEAKTAYQQFADEIAKDPKMARLRFALMKWNEEVVERYENQKTNPKPTYEMELHVLRIGDAAVCTNPFELFTDYGVQIKARSKAVQTFVVQLGAGPTGGGTYLPTERAVRGLSYGAIAKSCLVGPEGGKILVDRTVELINSMWTKPSQEKK